VSINKFTFSFLIFETANEQFCFKVFIFKFGLRLKGSWAGFDLNSTQLEHEFVIAKLDMQGILGMDFLEENDAHIFISA
jgi:hypothetical protein